MISLKHKIKSLQPIRFDAPCSSMILVEGVLVNCDCTLNFIPEFACIFRGNAF